MSCPVCQEPVYAGEGGGGLDGEWDGGWDDEEDNDDNDDDDDDHDWAWPGAPIPGSVPGGDALLCIGQEVPRHVESGARHGMATGA